ncbi:MAG: TRAP transporter small permease subunit [Alphaproteobacteria bacterium]
MNQAEPAALPSGRLQKIEACLFRLERALALLSGLTVFLLMLLAVLSVVGRNGFGQPLPGYVDWIEQAMPLIAFMGLSYCQRLGAHIRMDIVLRMLRGRMLWLFEFTAIFFTLIVILLLAWGSFEHFLRSFDAAMPLWSRDSSVDIQLPLWPAKLLAPIAFAVLSLRLCVHLFFYGRMIRHPNAIPLGIPTLETMEQVAKKEAGRAL